MEISYFLEINNKMVYFYSLLMLVSVNHETHLRKTINKDLSNCFFL